MCMPERLRISNQTQRIRKSVNQIMFGHYMRRLVLYLVTRPDNGQDLPLPINFAHLPDFEA